LSFSTATIFSPTYTPNPPNNGRTTGASGSSSSTKNANGTGRFFFAA
jgi:hypothetical protein